MGLLNSGMLGMLPMLMQQQQQPQQAPPPPQGGPMGGGLAGAFSNNPQFMQQLQAMQNQQSPGFQGAQMQPPQMPVSTSAPTGRNVTGGGMGGNPLNNYGMSMGDPLQQYLMRRMGQQGG